MGQGTRKLPVPRQVLAMLYTGVGESMTPCGSVLSTAHIPCCLQMGICSLDRLKPLLWNIESVVVTLPKQLIRFSFI